MIHSQLSTPASSRAHPHAGSLLERPLTAWIVFAMSMAVTASAWCLSGQTHDEDAGAGWREHALAVASVTVDILFLVVIRILGKQERKALALARQNAADMRESEELTRSVLENVTEAIVTVHVDGEIRMFNEAAEAMFLCSVDRAAGQNFDRFLFGLDWDQTLERIKDSQHGSVMVKGQRSSGEAFPCRIALGRVATEKQFCYIITARDESARIESEERMAQINQQLIDASHKSGMSEVMTGVLHNVGNILNSLQVSTRLVAGKLKEGRLGRLREAAEILKQHQPDLVGFLTENPQGQQFVDYLDVLSKKLLDDRDQLLQEMQSVTRNIDHIGHVIRSQQQDARVQLLSREEEPSALMDDACQILSGRTANYNIQIVRGFQPCPTIRSDRHKILQILVNLIKNAQEAVAEINQRPRVIRLAVSSPVPDLVQLVVKDNGVGMTRAQLEKVLTFGYTTKPDGHGFGLHSCMNTARQLGGEISVESPGPGLGSKFTLTLPANRNQNSNDPEESGVKKADTVCPVS